MSPQASFERFAARSWRLSGAQFCGLPAIQSLRSPVSKEDRKKIPPGTMKAIGVAVSLPFDMMMPMLVGGGVGYLIDRWLHTTPLFMLLLGFLGFGLGIRNVLARLSREERKNSER
jgi:F0F1-type ATP synthase assembly protein I